MFKSLLIFVTFFELSLTQTVGLIYHWPFDNSFNEVLNAKHALNDKLNHKQFTDDRFRKCCKYFY